MPGILGPFPRQAPAARPPLAAGRWQGFDFKVDSTFVGVGPIEVPSRGRRVVAQANVNKPCITVWDSLGGAQVAGLENPDPDSRIILWFDAPGVENAVVSPNVAITYYRLDGSGVYLPLTVPFDYLTTFDRLFLEVMQYSQDFTAIHLQLNIERWSKDLGDKG
jgi:hypothetical protein